jgi:FkbM family methyltransferase
MKTLKNLLKKMLLESRSKSTLDYRLKSGETILETIFGLVFKAEERLLVIDVGARNGIQLLPKSYTSKAHLIGFEPNIIEYEKLVLSDTDAQKSGEQTAGFLTEKYFQYAIWSHSGKRPFFITQGPGACTLMGESRQEITKHMYLDYPDYRRQMSFYDLHSKVLKTVDVECKRLDDLIQGDTVVDFLKLDVEGAELNCLKGAQKLLSSKKVLFVYTEFVAFEYYDTHCLFGDIHRYLADNGFRLLHVDLGHSDYCRNPIELPAHADRRLLHAGDAYFCLDPDRNSLSALNKVRLAIILFSFGFNSLAISLLRDSLLVSSEVIEKILCRLTKGSFFGKILYFWGVAPRNTFRFIYRLLSS